MLLLLLQAGSSFSDILNEKAFSEPQLVGFHNGAADDMEQWYVIAEKEVLLEVIPPTAAAAVTMIMAAYYCLHIDYPKSSLPATSCLLFLQETVLSLPSATKKTNRYVSLVNSLLH